jgi:acyl-CoA synthetase (AMP-forming)/AMP-acid ligase II
VFAVPDPTYGERVGAAVVLYDGEKIEPEEILQYSRNQLAAFEVPERLDIVPALPHTPKGALDRLAVGARFGH